jgi:integrase
MVYSFARVSAVVQMKVSDYRQDGKRFQVSLHEKGGKFHRLPVHHKAEEYIDEYLEAAGFGEDKKTPLWRSADGKSGRLTEKALGRIDVFKMIKRRAKVAGVALDIGCHTFRATGITAYLLGGGPWRVPNRSPSISLRARRSFTTDAATKSHLMKSSRSHFDITYRSLIACTFSKFQSQCASRLTSETFVPPNFAFQL